MNNKDLINEFKQAAEPLMEFIKKNYHPHATAIVTMSTAELVEGTIGFSTMEDE